MLNRVFLLALLGFTFISTQAFRPAPVVPPPSGPIRPPVATAPEKTIYIHGFSMTESNTQCQDQSTCSYWNEQVDADVVHVGYDGRLNPTHSYSTSGTTRLLSILNKYCRADRNQSCRVICHSMGCYTTSYVMANYNRSRTYRINYVVALASAEGGSEAANLGVGVLRVFGGLLAAIALHPAALNALQTSYARRAWDHNRNNGVSTYHTAGYKSVWYSAWLFPGKDDQAVAFHSTCAYREVGAFNRCGGETIKQCTWWIFGCRDKTITPYDGHQSSSFNRYGVDEAHNDFTKKKAYHKK